MGAKSNQKFIDSPEFDEFFRRGDEPVHGFDTLQPVADFGHEDESDLLAPRRTPAQVERRARFIKLVSITMACLTVGSASAFTYKAVQGHRPASKLAMQLEKATLGSVQAQPEVVAVNDPVKATSALLGNGGIVAKSLSEPETSESRPAAVPAEPPVAAANPEQVAKPLVQPVSTLALSTTGAAKPVAAKPSTTPATDANLPAAKTASAKTASAKTASPKTASPKTASLKTANAKTVGPKPADYHPPTASFSD